MTVTDSIDNGMNHLGISFLYNQSLVQASNLWTANTTGGAVDFCVKLSLYSNSSNGILFNFIETVYQIQVDLVSGFSTEVDIIRTEAGDGGVDIIDVDENITVYQCNDTYDEITSPPALTQGDSLQICVETEDGSVFEVESFKDVTVSQNGTKVFDYVSNFVDSYWASSSCKDTNTPTSVCKLKMQLLGDYFSDSDPADLTVEGLVKMDYLGRRRRVLHSQAVGEGRSLQYDNGGGAIFRLDVPVATPSATSTEDEVDTDVESTIVFGDMSSAPIILSSVVVLLTTGVVMLIGREMN